MFWLWWCGSCGASGWAAWARVWKGGVVLSLCLLLDWIICVDARRILGAPCVQSCCTLSISAS